MTDHAFELLANELAGCAGRVLWVVDENISAKEAQVVSPADSLSVLSNRYDISTQLKQRDFNVLLNDFELSSFPSNSFDAIYFRVPKEKAIVHHIINSAAVWLKPGGSLFLAGYKNDGIKTYASKAADYLGELKDKQRGDKTAMLFTIAVDTIGDTPLDDKNYSQARKVELKEKATFYSKPGIFGWDKVDQGSDFLISYLPELLRRYKPLPETILDLGCGYGYLSFSASQLHGARFTATDNNIAAVAMCRKNFAEYGVHGEAILDDCALHIQGQFDLILCNPPFHQGFDIEGDLTERFLQQSARLLAPKGLALFVVNSFIPLERKAAGLFSTIEVVANNRSFKLVVLER